MKKQLASLVIIAIAFFSTLSFAATSGYTVTLEPTSAAKTAQSSMLKDTATNIAILSYVNGNIILSSPNYVNIPAGGTARVQHPTETGYTHIRLSYANGGQVIFDQNVWNHAIIEVREPSPGYYVASLVR